MHVNRRVIVAFLGLIMMIGGTAAALAQPQTKSVIDEIRKELMQLPYYGVFDYIAFSYDKGTVTLVGYAYRPTLKTDAERAVKRVHGVDEVKDNIEVLPVSLNDDELRWKTYYAIYRDAFLSHYAPGGGALWGHRHPFGLGFHPDGPGGRFPGMEPAGDYPIHIIVKNGHITLLGVVDSEGDKTLAGLRAREVPGAFGVENDLIVEKT
jgi:hyperosmotically inducible protein